MNPMQLPKRSLDQNSLMWRLLEEFATQKKWHVNNSLCYMDAKDWKDLLTACYKKEAQRIARGIDGGIVLLGARTSKMDKETMNEFITYIQATGAELGIRFSAKA